MTRRFFGYDPTTGVTEWFHASDDGDSFTIEETQDLTGLVEANKLSYSQFTSGKDSFGDGATLNAQSHVASVPAVIFSEWVRTGKWRDQAFVKRWLNDPDNLCFRTRPGVI